MGFEIGARAGDYEILEELGAGGMGRVYKVRNVITNRIEALKVLLPDVHGSKELEERFLREIRVAAGLDHPNIARLFTAQRLGEQLVMLMEYIDGATVESLLHKGPLPLGDCIDYVAQVLGALSFAHERNIIHRDIKPANIMVTPGRVVKLMDFGIARALSGNTLTQTGHTVGTLYYMSPEQIQGAPDIDARCDIYSLGVSLYEMATGRRPFEGDSQFSIMSAHLNQNPVPPLEIEPSLPPALNDVILMAIAKQPSQRFRTAEAFRRALESIRPRAAAAAPPVEAPPVFAPPAAPVAPPVGAPPVASPAPAPRSHRGIYMALGSLATVVVLVLAALYVPEWLRSRASSDQAPSPEQAGQSEPAVEPPAVEPPAVEPAQPAPQPAAAGETAGVPASPEAVPGSPAVSRPKQAARPLSSTAPAPAVSSEPLLRPVPSAPPPAAERPATAPAPAPPEHGGADPARDAALGEMREQLMLMAARVSSVRASIDNMRRSQAGSGLGLRGDIASAEKQLEFYLDEAESAITRADAGSARKNLVGAERTLRTLERFLGR